MSPLLVVGCTIGRTQTITRFGEENANAMASQDGSVRLEVLQRLAEQAMTDAAFRAEAVDDLPGALARHGYDLSPQEMALVLRFRRSLADAGVDLDLVAGMGDERLSSMLQRLQLHPRVAGTS
jgi:hypothetical protein